ncbi:MAG TPA: hypothetical protein VN279_14945, partial [Rhodocyclaceae bacterium]|nr:hypothetical protein [Rhodocyclaceae bacterium]
MGTAAGQQLQPQVLQPVGVLELVDQDEAEAVPVVGVPSDTIANAIKRGTGDLEGVSYEEIRYEGYGIG